MAALRQEIVEASAPDQASLAAAVKLLKPALWSNLGGSADGRLVWGDCQGSGANPYRLAVDLVEIGSKCTCPSRKFPCKHALALMLMHSRGQAFAAAEVPPWVVEWMGRRKGGRAEPASDVAASGTPSLSAVIDEPEVAPDPRAEARREAQRARREAETSAAIRAGLAELEGWISDQLRGGLTGLMANLQARCRQMAARMVDARMGALAVRLDELPSRMQALPAAGRVDALVAELGNLVLMSRAWNDGSDPGLRRQIATTESREALLADPAALRVTARWSVSATREVTRRDGLVAQSTWLANRGEGPSFALLQDYFPSSAGRRSAAFVEGEVFGAEVVFFPSAHPLRAQIVQRCDVSASALPPAPQDPLEAYVLALGREPWVTEVPLLLPEGRLAQAEDGAIWWQGGARALPVLAADVPAVALGLPLSRAAMIWDGHLGRMLDAETPIGRIGFHG